MELAEKLTILTGAAKYDAACTSSGSNRGGAKGALGSAMAPGCCHSFSADGRCISLLKVLFSNACVFDCQYCVNRRSADVRRASFTPRELCELTIGFYRRNYIEGLFLSSAVLGDPDYTTEQMLKTLRMLREDYAFRGYIHAKAIPGADPRLTYQLGLYADRISVNIELPSELSLNRLAPDKSKGAILGAMGRIGTSIEENRLDIRHLRHTPKFAPAGQSTQMIVGATEESDAQILRLSEALYQKYRLKRVFFSAYVPVARNPLLPDGPPPLLREHRLYQADWLLRFYQFKARELFDDPAENLNLQVDPKCSWALKHMDVFPVEINQAPIELLLRVPGIGVISARRIVTARRVGPLHYPDLKKLGVVLKRAQYFILCNGRRLEGLHVTPDRTLQNLIALERPQLFGPEYQQLSLFEPS